MIPEDFGTSFDDMDALEATDDYYGPPKSGLTMRSYGLHSKSPTPTLPATLFSRCAIIRRLGASAA